MEGRSSEHRGDDEGDDLERADGHRDGHVAEHHEAAGDGRGEEVALGAALPVDDHADTAEDAAQGDEQADGADCHEAQVVDAADGARRLGQRGGDHVGKQDRGQQRDEDLARGVDAERQPPPRQRHERDERRSG